MNEETFKLLAQEVSELTNRVDILSHNINCYEKVLASMADIIEELKGQKV